jgi:hypothetical protein
LGKKEENREKNMTARGKGREEQSDTRLLANLKLNYGNDS